MIVCHVSSLPPTLCGIANYSKALIDYLPCRSLRCEVEYRSTSGNRRRDITIKAADRDSYVSAAAAINASRATVVSLQHEFGLFGGDAGSYVIEFIQNLRKPLVTTLHTTPEHPGSQKFAILSALINHSTDVIVLTEAAKHTILANFHTASEKIHTVRHGIPNVAFVSPDENLIRRHLGNGLVFISIGYMKPKKGYEAALRAFARLVRIDQRVRYVIVGGEQPQFERCHGYVERLRNLIAELELGDHVLLVGNAVSEENLVRFITACDIGIVNYADLTQNSSGVIPLILGCGRPIFSTPIEYARDTTMRVPGIFLMNMDSPDYITEAFFTAYRDQEDLRQLQPRIHGATRSWVWSEAASHYEHILAHAAAEHTAAPSRAWDRFGRGSSP
jgi:glycosyltransferase involved in cell wall biosynthesis